MKTYLELFIAMFIFVPSLVTAEPSPVYLKLKPDNYRTSKHYGACRTPRMSKRGR
jgi:hypothetical protein